MDDRAYLEGWKAAADYIGWGMEKLVIHRKELKEARIAFPWIKGTPPNRVRVIRIWKNLLQAWAIENTNYK